MEARAGASPHVNGAQRRGSVFATAGLGTAFDIAYDTMLATTARRDRLDAAIAEMAAASEFTPIVTRRVACAGSRR
jgi:transposase